MTKSIGSRGGVSFHVTSCDGAKALPLDGFLAMLNEVRVGFREVLVSKKAVVRRKGRGMRRFEDKVFGAVDVRTFLFRIVSPQYEDEMLALVIQLFYRRIGKLLPTFSLV